MKSRHITTRVRRSDALALGMRPSVGGSSDANSAQISIAFDGVDAIAGSSLANDHDQGRGHCGSLSHVRARAGTGSPSHGRARAGTGSLLLAVHRGRASEGYDFRDDAARLVVLVGIPFLALGDAGVVIKRKHQVAAEARKRAIQQSAEAHR